MSKFRVWFDDHELRLVPVTDDMIIDIPASRVDEAVEIAEGEAWSSESEFFAALQSEGINVREAQVR